MKVDAKSYIIDSIMGHENPTEGSVVAAGYGKEDLVELKKEVIDKIYYEATQHLIEGTYKMKN